MNLIEDFRLQSKINHANNSTAGDVHPIFSLRKLDWDSKSTKGTKRLKNIHRVAVSNGVVVIATNTSTIIRWKLYDTLQKEIEEIEIFGAKNDDIVEHIYIDPSSHHVIISMKSGENYYLHSRSNKVKKLSKLTGTIECVAFDVVHSTESLTKSFLAGTTNGSIYEISIDSSGKEKVCQVVFHLDIAVPITSIYLEVVTSAAETFTSSSNAGVSSENNKYFVMCATSSPTRLYHFVGGPTLQQMFAEYSGANSAPFTELPGELRRAELLCYSKLLNNRAQYFAVMTGAGIYNGSILGISGGKDSLLVEAQLIPYAESNLTTAEQGYIDNRGFLRPISFSVTEFHYLILRGDRMQSMSLLDGNLTQEEILRNSDGVALGIARDAVRDTNYIFTTKAIFQVEANNESRNVWSIYLKKALASGEDRMFDAAYENSKTKERKNQVMLARAEFCMENNQLDKAAVYFARSGMSFEDVALRLLKTSNNTNSKQQGNSGATTSSLATMQGTISIPLGNAGSDLNPLRLYLLEVLKSLPSSSKSQRTMICTWISEIYLHQITAATINTSSKEQLEKQRVQEFMDFVRTNRLYIDQATMFSLITSRNRRDLLIFFARISGDYHRVISMLITERRYTEAISVITSAPFEKTSTFIYEVAPILIEQEAEATVEMLLSKPQLSIGLLLPTILRYTSLLGRKDEQQNSAGHANYAVTFFEELLQRAGLQLYQYEAYGPWTDPKVDQELWSVSNLEAVTVHTMVWLLAKYECDNDEQKLCSFVGQLFELQEARLLHPVVTIDFEYILRQCRTFNRVKSTVFALLLTGQTTAAVKMSLSLDIELAKAIANHQVETEAKHSMWLLVAEHTIAHVSEMKLAINLIQESNNIITIQDLLPMLPEFTEIDMIKDEICASLEDCGARISDIKASMRHLSDSVENTLQELQGMKNRAYSTFSNNQKCEICVESLMREQFYLFPCSHGFHATCLLNQAVQLLSPIQLHSLHKLQDSIKSLTSRFKDSDLKTRAALESLQQDLDGIIAADCPLCGNAMIESISQPLVLDTEYQSIAMWTL